MPTTGRIAAALILLPAALALSACVVGAATYESSSRSERVVTAKDEGPELIAPPGGPYRDEAPARPAPRPAPPAADGGPELIAPPGGDVVIDGTPSKPLNPPPTAEPARPRSGSAAYAQAIDCAGALTALLNSQTYAMSQNQADAMAWDQAAWRDLARSMDGRADKEIDRRAAQLNDITADRIARACPRPPGG